MRPLLSLVLLLAADATGIAQTCTTAAGFVTCNDGRSGSQVGNTTHWSDGSTSTQFGNVTNNSDGTAVFTAPRLDNSQSRSPLDGARKCTQIGNWRSCE